MIFSLHIPRKLSYYSLLNEKNVNQQVILIFYLINMNILFLNRCYLVAKGSCIKKDLIKNRCHCLEK